MAGRFRRYRNYWIDDARCVDYSGPSRRANRSGDRAPMGVAPDCNLYPRLDSGEGRLSSTAALLRSRSGRPSFDFGRFDVADFRLACLLIPAASNAPGQEPMQRLARFPAI